MFQQHCAMCHDNPATRAPGRASLRAMSPSFVVNALTSGIMQGPGAALSPAQRVDIAEYLTGRKMSDEVAMAGRCNGTSPAFALQGPVYNGWGANPENWRYQREPGIAAADLSRLDVKWAFGFPGAVAAFGQPTVAGGRVFVGSQNGHVYSIDAKSGCYYWDFTASTGVRTAITVARVGDAHVALFGDRRGNVYSVDAATGKLNWRVTPDDEPRTGITGAPALFEGRLYVPISGGDDSSATDPKFECCKGRGAVVALDAATGKTLWITYTIPDAKPLARNAIGTQLWGPSGVSIWATPTIDAKRRMLYVGTGDNHSAPATDTSDAVLALALDTGNIVWTRQLLRGDMGNAACLSNDKSNCPEPHGPDYDLGTSPNLVTLANGKRVLTIGQKSGMIWALDPDDGGRIVWRTRVGEGGLLGGVQWGTATDGKAVYAAVSDIAFISPVAGQPLSPDPARGGGLHALRLDTGASTLERSAGERVRWPQELQSGAIRGGDRCAGFRPVRFRRWPLACLRNDERRSRLGLRHGQGLHDGQRHTGQRRFSRRRGTDDCGRHDLRRLRLRVVRRAVGQRADRVRAASLDRGAAAALPRIFVVTVPAMPWSSWHWRWPCPRSSALHWR